VVAGADDRRMKTFGQVIREARKKAGITQRELAARLKREDGRAVDPPYLNAVEHDHRYVPRALRAEVRRCFRSSCCVLMAVCARARRKRFAVEI
jgi:hypothetical protein